MRIQHNIMAMNAYRNYNNNTSALSKNLEKLSSGYKINRAGDDAAGLAISEKMRAQITGLNAAQKNVKDGVSLVKTAEGAMQEIQDMLNRMDYLATQSANGTYDDPVDRNNLQKEVKALKEEINRIADSANFNGIKLLDGSLDKTVTDQTEALKAYEEAQKAADTAKAAIDTAKADPVETKLTNDQIKNLLLPQDQAAGEKPINVAGTKNIYETEGTEGGKPEFSVELDGLANQVVAAGENLKLTVGGVEVKDANGNAIVVPAGTDQATDMEAKDIAALFDGAKVSIGGVDYTAEVATDSTRIKFTADEDSPTAVNPHLNVAFTPVSATTAGTVNNGTVAKYEIDLTGLEAGDVTAGTTKIDGVNVAFNTDAATTASDFVTAYNAAAGKNYTASVTGNKIVLTAKTAGAVADANVPALASVKVAGVEKTAMSVAQAGKAAGDTAGTAAKYTIDLTGGTEADLAGKAIDGVTIAWDTPGAGSLSDTLDNFVAKYNATADKDYVAAKNGDAIELTARSTGVKTDPTTDIAGLGGGAAPTVTEAVEGTDSKDIDAAGTTGSINVGTVDIKYTLDDAKGQLANTVLDLTGKLTEGTKIKLGDTTYTIAIGPNSAYKNEANAVKVEANATEAQIASALTKAAAANTKFSVGHNSNDAKITLQQLSGVKETTDMTTKDKLASYIGITTVANGSDEAAKKAAEAEYKALQATADDLKAKADKLFDGSPLTLQIGDTSDSFNQMKVNVGDMHVDAMGTFVKKKDEDGNVVLDEDGNAVMELAADSSIEDIDISTQEGAHDAIDVIKNAINYVSGIRGDLGAIQNRLEHTQNNLSVMAENIQDAESTIRDTDVAEEMMSYVKNNILVQSAQAMLAQANQVPQGVLQLLG